MVNYYDILGISNSASLQEVKAAYKKLSLKLHPDTNQGDKHFDEMFKNINAAYHVLSDPLKRKQYDDSLKGTNSQEVEEKEKKDTESHQNHNLRTKFSLSFVKKPTRKIFILISLITVLLVLIVSLFKSKNSKDNEPNSKIYRVIASRLNIRNAPDENAPIIQQIEKGGDVSIDTIITDWGKLSVMNNGYVNMKYLVPVNEVYEKERKEQRSDFLSDFFIAFFVSFAILVYLSIDKYTKDKRYNTGKRLVHAGLGLRISTQIVLSILIALIYAFTRNNS